MADTREMMRRLRAHVHLLAGDIGERNVFRPAALNDAASYIESEWSRQGYTVKRQSFEVSGVLCANLEVTRYGSARQSEILLIGAHYDSVLGSPGDLKLMEKHQNADPFKFIIYSAKIGEQTPQSF